MSTMQMVSSSSLATKIDQSLWLRQHNKSCFFFLFCLEREDTDRRSKRLPWMAPWKLPPLLNGNDDCLLARFVFASCLYELCRTMHTVNYTQFSSLVLLFFCVV